MSKVAFLGRSWSRRSRRAKGEPTQYPQIFLDLPIDLLRPPTEMPRWTPTSVRTGKQTEDKTKKLVPEAWNHVRRVISHQRQNKVRHNICVDVHLAMLLLSIVCNSIMLHMGHGQYLIYEYFQVIILKSVLSLLIRFSGFGKPCSYSPYIPSYSDGFSASDGILPGTFKCSTIKLNSRTFISFMELSPPLARPLLLHHNHHYHPPLSPPPLSQTPHWRKLHFHIFDFQILREFSQESFVFTSSLSVPGTYSGSPATHLGRATCAKKNSFSASHGPVSGR